MANITIKTGVSEDHRMKVAQLYYTAFRQKLHPIFRDEQRGLAVLERSLNMQYAVTAMQDGELVGIAGFKDEAGSLLDIQPQTMVEVFGFVRGWLRLLALSIFERSKQPGIFLMDGIVVDATMRGQGVGSQLLDAILEEARIRGYQQVRLDVVDTNPRARQLYERKGFVSTDTQHYPYLKWLFGFSGATTMIKTI